VHYKLLGLAVWRSGRWYMRRRKPRANRALALAVVFAALFAGAVAGRQAASSD
jgi:hypothetical protein